MGEILILKAKVACQKYSAIRNFKRKKTGNVLAFCSFKEKKKGNAAEDKKNYTQVEVHANFQQGF